MTAFRRSRLPSIIRLYENLRPLDRDLLKILNEREENLAAILDRGLSFSDNVDCVFVSYTTNAAPDTQDTVAHTLGKIPTGIIPVSLDKAGVIYKSGTYTAANLLLKCNVASVAATLLVF